MKEWQKIGLGWAIWMFVMMTFIWPLVTKEEITLSNILINFFYWLIAGLVLGYVIVKFRKYRNN